MFLIVVFLTGMYLYAFNLFFNKKCSRESFDEDSKEDDMSKETFCPDLLVNKGNVLLLYNTTKPEIKGLNPVLFSNLDEYIQYLEIQRKNGINCPILYLQKENDTQGNDVYRLRPSPFEPQGGNQPITLTRSQRNHLDNHYDQLPHLLMTNRPSGTVTAEDASRDNPPYNSGNYPGFDPNNQYVGTYTNLDTIHDSTHRTGELSDNPMDTNWGGVMFTEKAVDSGKYEENTVVRPTYTNPGYYPGNHPHPGGLPPPPNYVVN